MTDIVDSKRRSKMMAGIRGRDTAPELAVRRIAHRMGLRFRLHRKDLPGRPDLAFPKHRLTCHRLPDADERNNRQDDSLPPHGANVAGVIVPKPCHDDGSSAVIFPRWVILRKHRSYPDVRGMTLYGGSLSASMRHRNTMTILP